MRLPDAKPTAKLLLLGTALWGWSVERTVAFKLLDEFTSLGGRVVDTATNYPINKVSQDHGTALRWLSEWVNVGHNDSIAVLAKIGATNNLGGGEPDLTSTAIAAYERMLRFRLGASLGAIAVHWDNRGPSNEDAVAETLDEFRRLRASGLDIGFSGVRHPEVYARLAPDLAADWWIQVRENAVTQYPRLKCEPWFPESRYLAYGINMGGIQAQRPTPNSSLSLRGLSYSEDFVSLASRRLAEFVDGPTRPTSFNELALRDTFDNPALSGVILGARSPVQLRESMQYWNRLSQDHGE